MLLGIVFNTELNKTYFLRYEMIFMNCSLQIKQNIFSIGIFRALVVTQFIVKVLKKKSNKVQFSKDYHFSITVRTRIQ